MSAPLPRQGYQASRKKRGWLRVSVRLSSMTARRQRQMRITKACTLTRTQQTRGRVRVRSQRRARGELLPPLVGQPPATMKVARRWSDGVGDFQISSSPWGDGDVSCNALLAYLFVGARGCGRQQSGRRRGRHLCVFRADGLVDGDEEKGLMEMMRMMKMMLCLQEGVLVMLMLGGWIK